MTNGHNHVSGTEMPGCPACDSAFTGANRRWPMPLEEQKPTEPPTRYGMLGTLKRAKDVDTIAAVLARHTLHFQDRGNEEGTWNTLYKVTCDECGELNPGDWSRWPDESTHQARALVRHLTGKDDDD